MHSCIHKTFRCGMVLAYLEKLQCQEEIVKFSGGILVKEMYKIVLIVKQMTPTLLKQILKMRKITHTMPVKIYYTIL